jgi:beta-lactamase regulating signal transducer with metallopeptidase domain
MMNEIILVLEKGLLHHGDWLLSASLKVTAWLVIAGLILRLSRGTSASVQHAVAVIAAVGVPLIFLLDISPVPEDSGWRPFARSSTPILVTETIFRAQTQERVVLAVPEGSVPDASDSPEAVMVWSRHPMAIVVGFWWLGLMVAGIRFMRRVRKPALSETAALANAEDVLAVITDRESARLNLRQKPDVWILDGAMPMTFGLGKPAIVLPTEAAQWSHEKTATILRHELTHVRRRDLWWTLVVDAALLPVWWHPMARLLKRRVAELTEQACDDAVVAAGSAPAEYADYLLSLSRRFIPVRQARQGLPAISESGRVARFRRLLDETVCRRAASPLLVALIAMLALAFVVPGTLFLSCAGAEPIDASAPAAPDKADSRATPPEIAGVSQDAEQLMVAVKFFEIDISDGKDLGILGVSEWVEGKERFLSPETGFQMFHPQAKGVDILSAPKLVTLPGREAKVEILREMIYPTEFEDAPDSAVKTPTAFETTETGIVMKVVVRTTDDPAFLQADFGPTVTEFIGFTKDDAGLDVPEVRTLGKPYSGRFRNGSYLLVGEHMDEQIIEDTVPVLGSLPFIGKLFRAEKVRSLRKVIAVQVIVSEIP